MSTKTFDYTQYDYHAVGAPNLFHEITKGNTLPPITSPTMLDELSLLLATRNPGWRLLAARGAYALTSLYVFKGDESLGNINAVYYPRKGVDIHNDNIARTLERRKYKFTSDVLVARKLVEANFRPKPTGEKANLAIRNAHMTWTSRMQNAQGRRYDVAGRLSPFFRKALGDHAEAMGSLLLAVGAPTATIAEYLEHDAKAKVYEGMGPGSIVVTVDDYFYERDLNGKDAEPVVYSTDEVPPHLLQGVTILKMSPDETPVPGIGAKLGPSSYFIVKPS